MGNACDKFHLATTPNYQSATNPNKNICTSYEPGLYDSTNPTANTISVGSSYELNGDSGIIVPPEVCIQNVKLAEEITLGLAAVTVINLGPLLLTPSGLLQAGTNISIAAGSGEALAQTLDGDGTNKSFVPAYCASIGAVGKDENGNLISEWIPVTSKDLYGKSRSDGSINQTCHYNDCDNKTSLDINAGCCRNCCAIIGTKIACKRNAFLADPTVCCFLDNDCSKDNNIVDSCWQTSDRRRTCDPNYRNMKSPQCLDKIKPYCSGDKLFAGQNHWMELWLPDSQVDVNSGQDNINDDGTSERYLKQPCLRALARAVYSDVGNQICTWEDFQQLDIYQGVIDPAGLNWAQDVLDSILDKYINEFGSPIGAVNQDGYIQSSSFIDFYWNLCKTFPQICQRSLTNFCRDIKVPDLLEQPDAVKFCACYMTDDQYQNYEKFNVNRECTPVCNRKGVIPAVDDNDLPLICEQNLCIIDDLSIELNNVLNPGTINFNQICNSCGAVVNDINFDGTNSQDSKSNTVVSNKPLLDTSDKSFAQFIPSNSNEKFWYNNTDLFGDALLDDNGDMVVMLEPCTSNSKGKNYYPEKNLINAVVTLSTTSELQENFSSKNYRGTLYYIDGVNNYYFDGKYPFSKGQVAITKYLSASLVKSVLGKTKVSDITNNEFSANQDKIYKSFDNEQYQGVTWDFRPTQLDTYIDNYDNLIDFRKIADTFITKNTTENKDGSYKVTFDISSNIWKCWHHYNNVIGADFNISNKQKINNITRNDIINRADSTCRCILDGTTIKIKDATVGNLNLNTNCGGTECYDESGKTISCGSTDIKDEIIMDVKDSIKDFEKTLLTDKRKTISLVLLIILVFIIFVYIGMRSAPTRRNR